MHLCKKILAFKFIFLFFLFVPLHYYTLLLYIIILHHKMNHVLCCYFFYNHESCRIMYLTGSCTKWKRPSVDIVCCRIPTKKPCWIIKNITRFWYEKDYSELWIVNSCFPHHRCDIYFWHIKYHHIDVNSIIQVHQIWKTMLTIPIPKIIHYTWITANFFSIPTFTLSFSITIFLCEGTWPEELCRTNHSP